MGESREIEVPIFKHTKGGGKKVIGSRIVPLVYQCEHYVTVKMSSYNETYSREDLRMLHEPTRKPVTLPRMPKPPRKRRRRKE